MEGPSEFKSVYQNHSIEEDEAFMDKIIEENINNELAELSEPDFDDDEDESVIQPSPQEQQEFHLGATGGAVRPVVAQPFSQQEFHPHLESTPLQSKEFITQNRLTQNFQTNEDVILNAREGDENLKILYDARGVEIINLRKQKEELHDKYIAEIRQLKHENTLLKGNEGRIQINQEHYQSVAQAQSEENQVLRRQLDEAKANLLKREDTIRELTSDKEDSDRVIRNLQSDLQTLQKSDTILRQKHQHEETLRSLKERHETEVFQLQQEIDRLNAYAKQKDKEVDILNEKLRKSGKDTDRIVMEKSDTIKELQDRLTLSQKKLQNYIAESSAQGYTNVKAMHDRYQRDKEKYALDLCANEDEIKRLKISLSAKNAEIEAKEREKLQIRDNFEQLLHEKDSTIEKLSRNLHESESKITQLTRESLTGSTNAAVRRLQDELQKLKNLLDTKNEDIVTLKSSLEESLRKYKNLKIKIKQYKEEKDAKVERYKQSMTDLEEQFKTLRQADKEKVERLMAEREKEWEQVEMYLTHVDDQMKKRGVKIDPPTENGNSQTTGNGDVQITETGNAQITGNRRSTLAQPTGNGYVQITETGLPLLPQPTGNGYGRVTETGNTLGVGTGSDGENQSTDQLTRLLQNAKVNAKEDLEHRLKRPSSAVSERLPLGEIGTNRFH